MTILDLQLLGSFSVSIEGRTAPVGRKAQALLAYLAMPAGKMHGREHLSALLWGDRSDERARQSLRQCLLSIRKSLDPELDVCLETDGERIGLREQFVSVDAQALERASSNGHAAAWAEAVETYRGDLLQGLNIRSEPFEAWLVSERVRIRELIKASMEKLLDSQIGGKQSEAAIATSLRYLAVDPLAEHIHRKLMQLYFESGQSALALKQYDRCEEILKREVGVDPDTETRGLRASILRHRQSRNETKAGAPRASAPKPLHSPPDSVPDTALAREPNLPPAHLHIDQEIRFCTSFDGTNIAYATAGAGQPIVKAANWMTHLGHDSLCPIFSHWYHAFFSSYRLIRYDQRGNGLSDRGDINYTFEACVRDLETVVDAAGLERFPLLGISQGCAIALRYAANHPDRVSKLLLFGGFAKGWRVWGSEEVIKTHEALGVLIKQGWGRDNPAFRQLFTSLFLPDATAAQKDHFNNLQCLSTSPETAFSLFEMFGTIDVSADLEKIQLPTLVFHARGDEVISFSAGRSLGARIPGARFVPLESNNHLLLHGEPAWDVFLAEANAFLSSNTTPAN